MPFLMQEGLGDLFSFICRINPFILCGYFSPCKPQLRDVEALLSLRLAEVIRIH